MNSRLVMNFLIYAMAVPIDLVFLVYSMARLTKVGFGFVEAFKYSLNR